jgi:hypothetical protein
VFRQVEEEAVGAELRCRKIGGAEVAATNTAPPPAPRLSEPDRKTPGSQSLPS